jgi:hypothetical protein
MQQRIGSVEVADETPDASGLTVAFVSRRRLLRALPGVAIGVVALLGLTSCGGEDDEEDEDD